MGLFKAAPAPAGGDAQHRIGQGTQVIGDFFYRQLAFNVAGQGAKHLGMVGAAQQIQQGLVVVFAGAGQGFAAVVQVGFKFCGVKTLKEDVGSRQLVNHSGV